LKRNNATYQFEKMQYVIPAEAFWAHNAEVCGKVAVFKCNKEEVEIIFKFFNKM
jgi:hypothetical protein